MIWWFLQVRSSWDLVVHGRSLEAVFCWVCFSVQCCTKCAVMKGCLCSNKKRSFGNLAGKIEIFVEKKVIHSEILHKLQLSRSKCAVMNFP